MSVAKPFEPYTFVFEDDQGKFWVALVSLVYKTYGPYPTFAAAKVSEGLLS